MNQVIWIETIDGDSFARALADRHYSRNKKGAHLFVGPGEKMVLLTPDKDSLFVWRKSVYRMDGQQGIECTLFRNEGPILSSSLILEACKWAWMRWPRQRLFTYVKDSAVRSTNPGFCFQMAGWLKCGRNKFGKLSILENCNYSNELPSIVIPQQPVLFNEVM